MSNQTFVPARRRDSSGRAQIRQGRRSPDQRPRDAADLFRLPRRSLGPFGATNPIESVFATVRRRTVRMKGALSRDAARSMVFKLAMAASKTGAGYEVGTSCRKSSKAPNSATESRSRRWRRSAAHRPATRRRLIPTLRPIKCSAKALFQRRLALAINAFDGSRRRRSVKRRQGR